MKSLKTSKVFFCTMWWVEETQKVSCIIVIVYSAETRFLHKLAFRILQYCIFTDYLKKYISQITAATVFLMTA